MKNENSYFGGLIQGISSLLVGMKTTIKVFFRAKTTEQYPENRAELKMFDRFRGELIEHGLGNVFGPVVDVEDFFLFGAGGGG